MRISILLIALAACGGDDDGGDAAAADAAPVIDGGDDSCGAAPSDITCAGLDGAWVFENVSRSPDTISHSGELVITAGGTMAVAWPDPPPDATSDEDIRVTVRDQCSWAEPEPLTDDDGPQNAYASLAAEGEALHLVWSGNPGGSHDVYYSANSGGGWSEPVNLTAPFESTMGRHAYAPSISVGPGGEIAIAYLSAEVLDGGGVGDAVVRAAVLAADTIGDDPVTVIPTDSTCYQPRAIHDGDGALHVFAECGPGLDLDVLWATDAGGDWASEVMPMNEGHMDIAPTVAVSGGAVHAAWSAELPCTGGTCRRLLYTRLEGDAWTAPQIASQNGDIDDMAPSLAVAADGTVYIAFWRDNAGGKSDVYLTSSADGVEFGAPCNLTRTDAANEWMPSSLQHDPRSGKLHLLFEEFVPDSEPLDTEIVHAYLD